MWVRLEAVLDRAEKDISASRHLDLLKIRKTRWSGSGNSKCKPMANEKTEVD